MPGYLSSRSSRVAGGVAVVLMLAASAQVKQTSFVELRKPALQAANSDVLRVESGLASFYNVGFDGRKTANGEIYRKNSYSAAHRKLPFGTMVRVKNLRNNREVVVRINNRGPYVKGRIIDLSEKAARDLDMIMAGVAPVEISVLKPAWAAEKMGVQSLNLHTFSLADE